MEIALITSEESFLNNYGAALQGYAIFNTMESLGHSVVIVRYRGGCPSASTYLKSLYRYCNRIFHKYLKKSPFVSANSKGIKVQQTHFMRFQKEHLVFWNKKRLEWFQIKHRYPKVDIYICGSDQIWNPNYKGGYNDPGYFLDFAPAGKKRIAYAPSFACDDIPTTAQADLKYYIDKFYAVSVREKEGTDIIEKYTGRKAPVVADPTFLLTKDEWDDVATIPKDIPNKYILCYRFMKNNEMTRCIDYLSEMFSLPVITLPLSDVALADSYEKRFDVGPSDFVGLIRNATLVCTDSFHATAFSLIMNTPFYTFLDHDVVGKGTNMNSRVRNVIGIAGLESRVINEQREINTENTFDVDFTRFNRDIAAFREESLKWLQNALEGNSDE